MHEITTTPEIQSPDLKQTHKEVGFNMSVSSQPSLNMGQC